MTVVNENILESLFLFTESFNITGGTWIEGMSKHTL